MNWIILLSIKEKEKEKEKDTISLKLLFTDITLSSSFQKIEENINILDFNQIEKKITNLLNYKVALKDNIYIVLEDNNFKEYLKKYMPNIWNRISDEIDFKSFSLIISNIYKDRYECLLQHW